jgi:hypothetical protein
MKTPKTLTLIIAASLLLSACGAAAIAEEPAIYGEPEYRLEVVEAGPADVAGAVALGAPAAVEADLQLTGSGAGEVVAANSVPVAGDRLVLKTADMAVVVDDPIASLDAIIRMAEGMGGFVVNSNLYEVQTYEGKLVKNATLTIRVPSAQFGAALSQVEGSAVEVQHKNISGQDVTQAYTDLQSRLRNLEDAAAQLRAIMAQANKTEDVLTVYHQLVQVTEQIEVLKGQIQYYEEAAAFSAISLNLIDKATLEQPVVTIAGWTPQGVAQEAFRKLVGVLQDLATAAIWAVVYLLPVAVIFGVPLLVVGRWLKRLLEGKLAPAAPASGD